MMIGRIGEQQKKRAEYDPETVLTHIDAAHRIASIPCKIYSHRSLSPSRSIGSNTVAHIGRPVEAYSTERERETEGERANANERHREFDNN